VNSRFIESKNAAAVDLMMQQPARSKGLGPAECVVFNQIHFLDSMRLQGDCLAVMQVKGSPVNRASRSVGNIRVMRKTQAHTTEGLWLWF